MAKNQANQMKNTGKIFEDAVKNSIPDFALLYRLPDSAQAFGGGNLRFSRKNPFDFILWDSRNYRLFALELKTVQGKSISFERTKDDHGEIHYHQVNGLNQWNKYDGITCGFIIEFRAIERTIFIDISNFNYAMEIIPKKSFTITDLEKNKIPYIIIEQEKKRTRYKYDIEGFLTNINNCSFGGNENED